MNTLEEEFFADVARGVSTRPLSNQKPPLSRWMRIDEILASQALDYDPHNPGKKVLIGAIKDKLIGIEDDRHIMTVAGSRSGKSVGLISNLLFYQGSALITDPKGEIATKTAMQRHKAGQDIYIIDPFGTVQDDLTAFRKSYNPMSMLRLSNESILEDAALIAESIVIQPQSQKDPHWDESAKNFIEGVILHVATSKNYEGKRHLASVRDILKLANWRHYYHTESGIAIASEDDIEEGTLTIYTLASEMFENANHLAKMERTEDIGHSIYGAACDFFYKKENEFAGVLSTIMRHTKFLDYRGIRSVIKDNDFDLAELKTNKNGVSLYLCFPATRIALSQRWLRIFVNQLLQTMEREKTIPQTPVLACLDEFPVLGYMSQLETAAGLIASFGVKLWTILQDWSQGKALYGDRWETFVGNAGILQFFGNNDITTTDYIAKKAGRTAIDVIKRSDVAKDQKDKGQTGKSDSMQVYDLITADEASRLFSRDDPLKRQLIFLAGKYPLIMQRVEYFDKNGVLAPYLR